MDTANTLKDVNLLDVISILDRYWKIIESILGKKRKR
jgi:hypothetical protein